MFGHLFSRLPKRGSARAPRIALQAASVLAISGMLLSGAPRPAEAHANVADHSYSLNFTGLESVRESSELGSDEPYVQHLLGQLACRGAQDFLIRMGLKASTPNMPSFVIVLGRPGDADDTLVSTSFRKANCPPISIGTLT